MKKNVSLLIILAVLAVCVFAGCTPSTLPEDGITFTDALGRSVTVEQNPQRVVSLQGSFAETWLVAGGQLIGVTTDVFEDYNLDVGDAATVGTVKEPNTEILLSLNPDFVIMSQDIAAHREVAKLLDSVGVSYAYFKQETFDDYLSMLKIFTDITGNKQNYTLYGTDLKSKIDDVIKAAKNISDKPKVLFVRARSQGVSAKASDHMVCTILDEFGCVNIAAQTPSLLENLSIEQIIKSDPDIILVSCMGDENAAKSYLQNAWETNPSWSGLTAVKNDRYVFLQKDLFHFKPNARWATAYETLYQILFQ